MTAKERAEALAGLRPEVVSFAVAMEAALRRNDHKGGWSRTPPSWLLCRMLAETRELHTALVLKDGKGRVLAEAADVANFAMMVADVCGELLPAEKHPYLAEPTQGTGGDRE